ncbi:MAG TPA: hypothetical protein VEB42_01275, partial [Chitinophagaceae bacterium]|nr:hypothetical protein [Chitinophagaceae bacterium]
HYSIVVADDINQDKVYVPSLILNPIIENAIWHGLIPVKNERRCELKIEVKIDSGMLWLIIEDNGVGRHLQPKSPGNIRESKGTHLTEQRLANLNYLYNISSARLEYEDLFDGSNSPAGTRVIITLPTDLNPQSHEQN